MKRNHSKKTIEALLSRAGVRLNGDRPFDIRIRDERCYDRILAETHLGVGESYMDGWWECEDLSELIARVYSARAEKDIVGDWKILVESIPARISNRQSRKRAGQVGTRHYDLSHNLYRKMLDRKMVYSCAYWKEAGDLDAAQERKLDLVCRKLGLRPGMKILDIGCGWGSFLRHAAERCGVEAVGVTISREQADYARHRCRTLPVEVRLQDYRDLDEPFDAVVSLGMMEHVGHKNYREYMSVVNRCLKEGGLFLVQTIGTNQSTARANRWVDKYIFPNGMLPSVKQIGTAIEGLFVMEDWHNFSADYDRTLTAWYENFDRAWSDLKEEFDDRFYRMWRFYLLSFAGTFRARVNQLWQIVLSKDGVPGGYCSVR